MASDIYDEYAKKIQIDTEYDGFIIDPTLTDVSKYCSFNSSVMDVEFTDFINNEFKTAVSNEIYKVLCETADIAYINISNSIYKQEGSDRIAQEIVMSKNCLTSNRLFFEYVYDTRPFVQMFSDNPTTFYKGNLQRCKIYCNPIPSWSENRMVLVDHIGINVVNLKIHLLYEDTFMPRVHITYGLCVKADNARVFYVIEGKDSPHYDEWVSYNRNKKIDTLL